MKLSTDQATAVDGITEAFASGHREVTLRGLAGTGKTSIVKLLIERLKEQTCDIRVLAPTGKAASVLSDKLGDSGYDCQTIHKFAYQFRGNVRDKARNNELVPVFDESWFQAGIIIVDEASMVGQRIYDHLVSAEIPILWVGDHGQLPPVNDSDPGVVSDPEHPCFTLEQVHRQDEGNGILDLAYHVRTGGSLKDDLGSPDVAHYRPKSMTEMVEYCVDHGVDTVITATNKYRNAINLTFRKKHGFLGGPGDSCKMICLRNNYSFGMFNGEVWSIAGDVTHNRRAGCFTASLVNDLGHSRRRVVMTPDLEYQERDKVIVDYGFGLTCHKSQGSEWDHVAVIADGIHGDYASWAYTAVTRAEQKVSILYK